MDLCSPMSTAVGPSAVPACDMQPGSAVNAVAGMGPVGQGTGRQCSLRQRGRPELGGGYSAEWPDS